MAKNADVAVLMGSDSDLPVMKEALDMLQHLGISCEVKILSAHRSPEDAADFAKNARKNGTKVIIAGAGGAAHLAGVMASLTTLPVIGVPMESQALKGMDSLLSTVQMPSGVPVATVGINGAKNAGILAAEILGLADKNIAEALQKHKKKMADSIREKNKTLKV